jgi:hypothetical protein
MVVQADVISSFNVMYVTNHKNNLEVIKYIGYVTIIQPKVRSADKAFNQLYNDKFRKHYPWRSTYIGFALQVTSIHEMISCAWLSFQKYFLNDSLTHACNSSTFQHAIKCPLNYTYIGWMIFW